MDNEPATKADLNALRDGLIEALRDSETRLLKAFYTFAESNQQRLAQTEGNQAAFTLRLATIESRVTELEKRLNTPPATQ